MICVADQHLGVEDLVASVQKCLKAASGSEIIIFQRNSNMSIDYKY